MANKSTYLEMVSDAIVTLKERNGSSQYAIRKFIGDKYKDLPVNFKKTLLIQLKKLVASDKLVKVKASYKLLSTAKIVAAAKPKKGAAPAKKKPTAPAKTKDAPVEAKLAPKAKPAAKAKWPAKAKPAAKVKPIRHQKVQTNQSDELARPETTNGNSVVTVKTAYKKNMVTYSLELPDGFIKLKASYKLPSTTKTVASAKQKKGAAPPKKKPTTPAKTKAAPAKAKLVPKAKAAAKAKPAPKAKQAAKPKPPAKAKTAAKAKPIRHQQVQTNQPDELAQPEETTVVTVKAKYKNQLESFSCEVPTTQTTRSSERFIKLKEEIAARFQLKQGSFKLKYEDPDEDGDMIMITCDSSLSQAADDFKVQGLQTDIILVVLPV